MVTNQTKTLLANSKMQSLVTGKPMSKKVGQRVIDQINQSSSKIRNVVMREEMMEGIDVFANEAFRQCTTPQLLTEKVEVTKKIYNYPTIPCKSFRNNAFGITMKDLVLVASSGMSFWNEHPNPNGLRDHIAALLEKESFVKKFTALVTDTTRDRNHGRWAKVVFFEIGFMVNKKKFKRWFRQNQNRFLQYNNLHK